MSDGKGNTMWSKCVTYTYIVYSKQTKRTSIWQTRLCNKCRVISVGLLRHQVANMQQLPKATPMQILWQFTAQRKLLALQWHRCKFFSKPGPSCHLTLYAVRTSANKLTSSHHQIVLLVGTLFGLINKELTVWCICPLLTNKLPA